VIQAADAVDVRVANPDPDDVLAPDVVGLSILIVVVAIGG